MTDYDINVNDFEFVQKDKVIRDEVYETNSYLRDVFIAFKKNKGAVIGVSLSLLLL